MSDYEMEVAIQDGFKNRLAKLDNKIQKLQDKKAKLGCRSVMLEAELARAQGDIALTTHALKRFKNTQ